MSKLLDVSRHFRQKILEQDAQTAENITRQYQSMLPSIERDIAALQAKMEAWIDANPDAESLPLHWLYEESRLNNLLATIRNQVDLFAKYAHSETERALQSAMYQGLMTADSLLQATIPRGIHFSFGIVPPSVMLKQMGFLEPDSPLAKLFQQWGNEAAEKARTALLSGVANGDNPRKVAHDLHNTLGTSYSRARTIARTEIMRTWRHSQFETYRKNSDVLNGWIWQCALLKSSCVGCVAMHGTHHDLSETLDDHPSGACQALPETKSWADILDGSGIDTSDLEDTSINIGSGSDWFDGQDEDTQRAILGAKYDGWANGDFSIADLVGISSSDEWGDSIRVKSLKEMATI